MRRRPLSTLHVAHIFLILSAAFSDKQAIADSIIRITGDKTKPHNAPALSTDTKPLPTTARGTTIRIIGDKSVSQTSTVVQPAQQESNQQPHTQNNDNSIIAIPSASVQEAFQVQPPEIEASDKDNTTIKTQEDNPTQEMTEKQLAQRLSALTAEKERKIAEKAEQDRLTREKADLLKETTRQAAIKHEQEQAEETRKAAELRQVAEKAEQERLAKAKAEQENEAQQQAAMRREQDKADARKAEELRQAAEKAEQERLAKAKSEQENEALQQAAMKYELEQLAARKAEELRKAALKADKERLTTDRQALDEKLLTHIIPPLQKHDPATSPEDIPSTSVNRFDPGAHSATGNTTPEPSSIWDLYLSAKSNDPALGRTEARVSGSKAESDIIFSALLPHLNSSAGVKQISQSLTGYGTTSSNFDYTALNYNATAQLTLLHVPTLYSLSAAAAGLSAEQAAVTAARQNLIVKFTDSYFALLKAQTDKQIALGEINRLKQVLEQSQAFLKAGTGDIISVYEAQSRLDSATADLTKSESNLRLAEQKLSSHVGKTVTEVVNYLPKQPAGPDPDNLDWWVATMEKEQPAIRQARASVEQASEQRKSAKSEYLPVLQASGGYDVNRGTAALPTAEVKQWFVGATLTLPLYSGGETSAKIRRATASEEERRHAFDETMDQQRENVKQAFFNLRYNISMIKALDQRKLSAEIQLAAVKKGRKIGTRNAIDVLNAEQSYSLALRDYRYALYDNITRVIQLKSSAGILGESDISMLSDMEAAPPATGLNLIISMVSK